MVLNDEYDGDDMDLDEKKGSDEFARMLEESFQSSPKKQLKLGDKVKAEILVIGKEEVFVTTGTQNDGTVSRRDLLDKEGNFPYKTGDKLDLFVTNVKGTEITLSPKPTGKNMSDDLYEAYQNRLPVEGKVTEIVKGGVRVSILGKAAFCPISQLDTARVETGEEYIGKKLAFRITQFSEGGRNIVVSRRKLMEEEQVLTAGSFLAEHKPGDVVAGRIARIEPFGAFVELAPGVDGLAHISELSWSRVADPSEVVKVGQEVQAKILKIEQEGGRTRISLSLKAAGGEPWANFPAHIKEGAVVEGKVTRCMKFGAFVEVAPGIEGLVPLSEMSHTRRVMRSDELIGEGEKIQVAVKEIDSGARRILLSLKDAGQDPWQLVAQKYPVGTILKGKVTRREGYGLFIEIEEGITALLPKTKALEGSDFPFDKLRIGDTATVQVMELRIDERRIALCPPGDPSTEDWKSFVPEASTSSSFGTLGDKLKAAMAKKTKT